MQGLKHRKKRCSRIRSTEAFDSEVHMTHSPQIALNRPDVVNLFPHFLFQCFPSYIFPHVSLERITPIIVYCAQTHKGMRLKVLFWGVGVGTCINTCVCVCVCVCVYACVPVHVTCASMCACVYMLVCASMNTYRHVHVVLRLYIPVYVVCIRTLHWLETRT